jgi:hypothetical protein
LVVLRTKPEPSPQLAALALPPTTDWLLDTPRADWLTRNAQHTDKERPDEN